MDPSPTETSFDRSEAIYHALFNASLDAVLITAPDGRILEANPTACALFGRSVEELRRLGRAGVVDPDDTRIPAALEERERTGRFVGEINFKRADGSIFTAEMSSAVFHAPGGERRTSMVIRDISARKRAEEALRASEEMHRGLLETAFDGNVIHQDGLIVSANQAYAAMFGYPLDELVGKSVYDLVAPEARAQVATQIRSSYHKTYFTTGLRRDNTRFTLETTARSFLLNGRPARVAAVRDVSDRERAQQELLRLASIVRSSDDAIIGKTLDGIISTWNPAAERIFGYSEAEAIGQPMGILFPEERREEEEQILAKIRKGESVTRLETVRRRKNGELIEISATISPILNAAGDVIGASKIARDITEMKASESKKRDLEMQLSQAQRLETIGTLAGGIAHDFNNILTGLSGFIELARHSLPTSHEAYDYLQSATEGAVRARDLVKRLLLFARQAPSTTLRPVSLSKLVGEISPLLTALLPTSITIQTRLPEKLGSIMADSGQLQQVLMNLCVNAAHAIGPHHGVIVIEVEEAGPEELGADGTRLHRYARLSVTDNGCGMDEATQKKIFDPFFTTKPPGEGSGLGLSIVHGIVKAHGGLVKVASAPGRGTSFDVYLPLTSESETAPTLLHGAPTMIKGAGLHVLVADDEKQIREVLSVVLTRAGFDVVLCHDGAAASGTFSANYRKWDLAVIDLSMPGRTGLEIIGEIRARRPDLPVILMSGDHDRYGHDAPEDQLPFTRLAKPFSVEGLKEAIATAMPGIVLIK